MFSQRLKAVRELRDLTQEELGRRCNINPHNIYRYEKDETKPNTEIVAILAKVLEVSADYLLGLTDDFDPEMIVSDLTLKEKKAIFAWRQGDRLNAIKLIANES